MSNAQSTSCCEWIEQLAMTTRGDFSLAIDDRLDDQACLKLFYRSLLENDQSARELLQQRFYKVILGWMQLHPRREEAYRLAKAEYYIEQTFEHFWRGIAEHKGIDSPAAVLRYLQASLNSVVMDTLRAYSCSKEVGEAGCAKPEIGTVSAQVWQSMQGVLSDAREERLAYLLFHCGLKPREIVNSYPEEFSDVQEIARLRRQIIERVLRDLVNAP